jgi:hypothetical protein
MTGAKYGQLVQIVKGGCSGAPEEWEERAPFDDFDNASV